MTNLVEHVDPKSILFKELRVENLNKKIRVLDEHIYDLEGQIRLDVGGIDGMYWIESLPIESLMDLYNVEQGNPTEKMSLQAIEERTRLRKDYEKLVGEREVVEQELKRAKIDLLLSKIEDTLKE